MAIEFVVAVKPNGENLDNEIDFIKSVALYADKINVISPSLNAYELLSEKAKNKKNIEMDIISKLLKSLPICAFASKEDLSDQKNQLLELESVVKSGGYKSSRLIEKMRIQNILKESQVATVEDLDDIYGIEKVSYINELFKNKMLLTENYKNTIIDVNDFYNEYIDMINKSLDKSFVVVDEDRGENLDINLPVYDLEVSDLIEFKKSIKKDLNDFKLALNKYNKEIIKLEKKNENVNYKELFDEIVRSFADNLVNVISESEFIKDKEIIGNISFNIEKRNSFNNSLDDFVKKSMTNSALVGDKIDEINSYDFEEDNRSVILVSYNK